MGAAQALTCSVHHAPNPVDQLVEELIEKLFHLQDLNDDGVLEELELIQLNKKIQILHYGQDIDKEEVRRRYREIFRANLDPEGEPVPLATFRRHTLAVLRGIDPDKYAQILILEQWIAEADLARESFQMPSMQSISDIPFLLLMSPNQENRTQSAVSSRDHAGDSTGDGKSLAVAEIVGSERDGCSTGLSASRGAWSITLPCALLSFLRDGAQGLPAGKSGVQIDEFEFNVSGDRPGKALEEQPDKDCPGMVSDDDDSSRMRKWDERVVPNGPPPSVGTSSGVSTFSKEMAAKQVFEAPDVQHPNAVMDA